MNREGAPGKSPDEMYVQQKVRVLLMLRKMGSNLTQPLSCVLVCTTLSMEKRKKTRELSEDLRNRIVRKHEQSQGYKSISKDLNVPVSTVRSVIKKCKAHGTVANLPRCGGKRKIDKRFQRKIVRMLDKEPRLTSKQVQAALQSEGTTVSTRTIRRRLNEKGLYGRRPRKTPLLTPRHKKARLEFAKTYLKKPKTFWKNVLWSDETKLTPSEEAFLRTYAGVVNSQLSQLPQHSIDQGMCDTTPMMGAQCLPSHHHGPDDEHPTRPSIPGTTRKTFRILGTPHETLRMPVTPHESLRIPGTTRKTFRTTVAPRDPPYTGNTPRDSVYQEHPTRPSIHPLGTPHKNRMCFASDLIIIKSYQRRMRVPPPLVTGDISVATVTGDVAICSILLFSCCRGQAVMFSCEGVFCVSSQRTDESRPVLTAGAVVSLSGDMAQLL
ncbi:unnamed protein product [Ranitomeya imitator]|uniref:Transposase Tc1-like domain-containing protein n=1 Tax=Ranitomeya imitator TaxID=111125 RepID=A0ABN9LDI3_9NEOB|nr:unnamed protein product [Ranitomeya imitator]